MADPLVMPAPVPVPTNPTPRAPDWITAVTNGLNVILTSIGLAILAWAANRFASVTTPDGRAVTAVPVVTASAVTQPTTPPVAVKPAPASAPDNAAMIAEIERLIAAIGAAQANQSAARLPSPAPASAPSLPSDPISVASRDYQRASAAQLKVIATRLRSGEIKEKDALRAYNDAVAASWQALTRSIKTGPDLADALETAGQAQEAALK